ncbi:hypothetical protein [Rosistilla carotiformis]|uniref:hypothetical protein n=1 Tax=Rosistilla carotiformis TaxID=2528017 RepID=UPI0018D1FE4B|nr:hypothetical protein [Rosistilla carotiformis]
MLKAINVVGHGSPLTCPPQVTVGYLAAATLADFPSTGWGVALPPRREKDSLLS